MSTKNRTSVFVPILQSLMPQFSSLSGLRQLGEMKLSLYIERWKLYTQQLSLLILALVVITLCHEPVQAQNAPPINVSPKSLVFAAEEKGANPAAQELNVSTTDGRDLTWTASKTTPWLTLSPITANQAVPLKATVTTHSLAAETYHDVITLAIAGTEAAKIPVTLIVTPPKGSGPPASPQNTNKEEGGFVITDFKNTDPDPKNGGCIKDLSAEPVAPGDFGNHISFGPTVAAKAFNYDLASKKIAFNAGLGAGLSMRFYNTVGFKGKKDISAETFGISQIRKRCRAETFDPAWLKADNQMVIPLFSISPMVFASKSERADEIQVQPAVSVGFLGELVNIGVGFNLSGPDKGHVFVLLSLGYGFKF